MILGTLYGSYFSSWPTLITLALPVLSMMILYILFKSSSSPRSRSWSIGLMLLSSIFLWIFIASSLILCYAFERTYQFELAEGVLEVFGRALLISIGAGIPLALTLRKMSPQIVLGKAKELEAPPKEIGDLFNSVAVRMGIRQAQLQISKGETPISFVAHVEKPVVVMSNKLLTLLKKDEIEAVIAHELAHVKNSDTALKSFVTAYRTVLPFDPIIRILEAAFHREREIVADETAANVTKKPISLAMSLIKIYEAFPRNKIGSHSGLSILGSNSAITRRHPAIDARINNLLTLAEKLPYGM
jgi:Zn-dependent protease with chaperone function